jgi:predicted HTH domain antitoxin
MRILQLNIPETLDLDDREAKMMLASKLFERGKLTLGQAAKMVGLSKTVFMELLKDYDVSVINHSPSEIEKDADNAKDYSL